MQEQIVRCNITCYNHNILYTYIIICLARHAASGQPLAHSRLRAVRLGAVEVAVAQAGGQRDDAGHILLRNGEDARAEADGRQLAAAREAEAATRRLGRVSLPPPSLLRLRLVRALAAARRRRRRSPSKLHVERPRRLECLRQRRAEPESEARSQGAGRLGGDDRLPLRLQLLPHLGEGLPRQRPQRHLGVVGGVQQGLLS